MKKSNFKICILIMVATSVLVICCARDTEKIKFRRKFEKGKSYEVQEVIERNIWDSATKQGVSTSETFSGSCVLDINDVDEHGNAWFKYTLKCIKFKQIGHRGEVEYDSSKKVCPVSPEAQYFAAIVGESLWIKATPRGRFEEVKGLEKMHSNMVKKIPDGIEKKTILDQLKWYYNQEGVRESLRYTTIRYPEKAVGIGDSWSEKVVISQGLSMIRDRTWKLKDRKNGISIIEFNTIIKPNPQGRLIEWGSMEMSYQCNGKEQGMVEVLESTGQVIRSKMHISAQITMESVGGKSEKVSWPMSLDGNVAIEIYECKKRQTK